MRLGRGKGPAGRSRPDRLRRLEDDLGRAFQPLPVTVPAGPLAWEVELVTGAGATRRQFRKGTWLVAEEPSGGWKGRSVVEGQTVTVFPPDGAVARHARNLMDRGVLRTSLTEPVLSDALIEQRQAVQTRRCQCGGRSSGRSPSTWAQRKSGPSSSAFAALLARIAKEEGGIE